MSARAAWRLESLGFQQVYRYPPGKDGWVAAGLPSEGAEASTPRAKDAVDRHAPTCAPEERLGAVRERLRAGGWTSCIVVNERGVVLGRIRGTALEGDAAQTVAAVMEAGPTTARPGEPLAKLIDRMQKRRVGSIILTTPDGVFVGVLRRADGEQFLAEQR